jgi:hypothetical protein
VFVFFYWIHNTAYVGIKKLISANKSHGLNLWQADAHWRSFHLA